MSEYKGVKFKVDSSVESNLDHDKTYTIGEEIKLKLLEENSGLKTEIICDGVVIDYRSQFLIKRNFDIKFYIKEN